MTNSCWHRKLNTTGQTLPSEGESFLQSLKAARSHVTHLSRSECRKASDLLGVSNLLGGTSMGAPAGHRNLLSPGLLLGIYIWKLWSCRAVVVDTSVRATLLPRDGAMVLGVTEPRLAADCHGQSLSGQRSPACHGLRCPWTSLPPRDTSKTWGGQSNVVLLSCMLKAGQWGLCTGSEERFISSY